MVVFCGAELRPCFRFIRHSPFHGLASPQRDHVALGRVDDALNETGELLERMREVVVWCSRASLSSRVSNSIFFLSNSLTR
jgi:hypothetical protein